MLLSFLARKSVPCLILGLTTGLAGCATTASGLAHYGGVENPADVPANALHCQSRETAENLQVVERRRPRVPENLGRYLAANQSIETLSYYMLFDVDSAGRTRNIRYGGDPERLSSINHRNAVFRMASAIKDWRFAWNETADTRYAAGCEAGFDFFLRE